MDICDWLITAGIGLLVFFLPVVWGGVEVWAANLAQAVCFALALLWMAKLALTSRTGTGLAPAASGDFRALAPPMLAVLSLLTLQLIPLPPAMLRVVSPHSYELYRESLPGWPSQTVYGDAAYVRPAPKADTLMTVLPTVDEVKSGAAIPFAPQPAGVLKAAPIAAGRWRSISIAPILTRAALLKCAAYAALFLVVVFYRAASGDAHAEHRFRRVLILMVMASGVAAAIIALSQQALFYGGSLAGAAAGTRRASGTFVNPDHFANYVAMVLPMVAAGALFRVPLDRTEEFSGFQFLCAAAALVMATAIVLSLSRAGWIEIGLGTLIFAWMLHARRFDRDAANGHPQRPHRGIAWILPAAAALIAIAAVSLILVGNSGREDAGARMAQSVYGGVGFRDRIDMWIDSGGIVRDFPLFGSGSDTWPTIFPRYQRPPWTMFFAGEAQNDYVEAAAECGLLGMALLGWLCWTVGRKLYDGAVSIPSRHWPVFAAAIAALIIMAFHETLDFCMQIPANAVMFVLIAGLAMRLVRTYGGAPIRRAGGAGAAVPAIIAIAAAGLVGVAYQRETVYPDDLAYPATIRDNETSILEHPASPIPHLWLADRIHRATGVWLTPELRAAIWLDPTNPHPRDRYVQALLSEGKKDEALEQIAISTWSAPELSNHGYLNARLIRWLPAGERAAAERGLRRAMDSGFAGAMDALAQLYFAENRPLDAAALYAAAAGREPDTATRADLTIAAAMACAQAGKRHEAENYLLSAAKLVPGDPRPYNALITAIYGPARNAQAANHIIQVAAENGVGPAQLYSALQDAAQKAGDRQLAEAALRAAVNTDPSYSNWMRLGGYYLAQNQFGPANTAIRRAIAINPDSGEAYFRLAQAEEGAYQYPAARADYDRAIALEPNNAQFKSRSLDLARKIADADSKQ